MNGARIWRRRRAARGTWAHGSDRVAWSRAHPARWRTAHPAGWRRLAGVVAATVTVGSRPASAAVAAAGQVTVSQGSSTRYQATIMRTAYGVPHITAGNFGSLGYGYGYALASDDLCTMAQAYVTVEGDRSLYFGPYHSAQEPGAARSATWTATSSGGRSSAAGSSPGCSPCAPDLAPSGHRCAS